MSNGHQQRMLSHAVIAAALIACTADIATAKQPGECAISTIAFSSTRDDPTGPLNFATEIYLMDVDVDGTNPRNVRRLTHNTDGDIFAALSPDGKGRIVFNSNRARAAGEPDNTSDLFLMKKDGSHPRFLTRGSSATWSPDGKYIAFHASASGMGQPINPEPGAATTDSDIFVAKVRGLPNAKQLTNLTNNPYAIDDDPDWSPDGKKIAFTSRPIDGATSGKIYVMNVDGTGLPERLTFNVEEERAPNWSPDGKRIAYMCRIGGLTPMGVPTFEICVVNADGTGRLRLTTNSILDGTPSWSPDGQTIVFHRPGGAAPTELWLAKADGSLAPQQFTDTDGINLFANWGVIDKCADDDEDLDD